MATFSVTEAAGSGFKIIFSRPLSVLAWGFAYLIVAGVPAGLVIAWAAPDILDFMHTMAQRAQAGDVGRPFDPADMMPFQGKMMLLQPVLVLTSLLGRAVLAGAIFRAVLEPANRGFAGLRIGAQELWLAVLSLAAGVLWVLLCVGLAVGCGLAGFAIMAALNAAHAASAWTAVSWVAVCLVGLALALWILVRFSLAFPMTFAEREFRLFESWSLTKGHAWSLFGLALLLLLILIAVMAVVDGAILGVVFGTGLAVAGDHGERIEAFFRQPPEVWLRTVAPWAAVAILLGAWISAAIATILLAPWAVAYRGLAGDAAAPEAFSDPYPAAPTPVADHADHGAGHGGDPGGGHDDGHHHGH